TATGTFTTGRSGLHPPKIRPSGLAPSGHGHGTSGQPVRSPEGNGSQVTSSAAPTGMPSTAPGGASQGVVTGSSTSEHGIVGSTGASSASAGAPAHRAAARATTAARRVIGPPRPRGRSGGAG